MSKSIGTFGSGDEYLVIKESSFEEDFQFIIHCEIVIMKIIRRRENMVVVLRKANQ